MSDDEFVDAAIKQQRSLFDCQVRIRKQQALLEECERALEAIIEDQATGGGDDTFPIAKTLLAKLRGQERGEHSFALEILQALRHKESKQ